MSDRLPPQPEEQRRRIGDRPADSDFARFPPEEVDEKSEPGAGPHGAAGTALNVPMIVIAIGLVLAFLTFVVGSGWPLVLGLVLVVGGAIWAGLRA